MRQKQYQFCRLIWDRQYLLMSTETVVSEPVPFLSVAIATALVLVVLKRHFSGGVFTIPAGLSLAGKRAVVTGGNSGIGEYTVRQLAQLGCQVVIGARNRSSAEKVIKHIKKTVPDAHVEFIPLELDNRESIEAFAKAVPFPTIDYLVNNAGVMAIPTRKLTKAGEEMQWGVNHLGHFYLTYLLWSKIKQVDKFRVINVSSIAHRKTLGIGPDVKPDWQNMNFETKYNPQVSYSRSKLYNVLFTHALAEKIGSKGLTASLHPGVVRTELMREMFTAGFLGKLVKISITLIWPLYAFFTKSSLQGSYTTMYTLLSDEVENGQYYSDCKRGVQNIHVTKENWDRLWEISEKTLGIKFTP